MNDKLKRTAGRINVTGHWLTSESGAHIVTSQHFGDDRYTADLQHLALCWNACEGLPDGALEGGWTAMEQNGYYRHVEQERDAAVRLLKRLRETLAKEIGPGALATFVGREVARAVDDMAALPTGPAASDHHRRAARAAPQSFADRPRADEAFEALNAIASDLSVLAELRREALVAVHLAIGGGATENLTAGGLVDRVKALRECLKQSEADQLEWVRTLDSVQDIVKSPGGQNWTLDGLIVAVSELKDAAQEMVESARHQRQRADAAEALGATYRAALEAMKFPAVSDIAGMSLQDVKVVAQTFAERGREAAAQRDAMLAFIEGSGFGDHAGPIALMSKDAALKAGDIFRRRMQGQIEESLKLKALCENSAGLLTAATDEQVEAAYWFFDARHKGYAEFKGRPASERDAFKWTVRQLLGNLANGAAAQCCGQPQDCTAFCLNRDGALRAQMPREPARGMDADGGHWKPVNFPFPKDADADDWIEWNGGSFAPVDGYANVSYRLRDGFSETARARDLIWSHSGDGRDIVAYRLARPAVAPSGGERDGAPAAAALAAHVTGMLQLPERYDALRKGHAALLELAHDQHKAMDHLMATLLVRAPTYRVTEDDKVWPTVARASVVIEQAEKLA